MLDSFQKIINELAPEVIASGVSVLDFYNLTIGECVVQLEGYKKRLKDEAQLVYAESVLIGSAVGQLFSNKKEFPTIYDAFPSLFNEEIEELNSIEAEKNRVMDWVKHHNSKRKE